MTAGGCTEKYLRHKDGRRVRVFMREWRVGFHPDHEGKVEVKIQRVLRVNGSAVVDCVRPIWEGWVPPDSVDEVVDRELGPGWNQ
jgi:hypothetical protein